MKNRYYCQISIKLEFSQQTLEKYSNIQFNENRSVGAEFNADGRTDRHDDTNSRVSQFCEHASKRKYCLSRGYGMSIKTGCKGGLVCRDRSVQSGVRLFGPFRL